MDVFLGKLRRWTKAFRIFFDMVVRLLRTIFGVRRRKTLMDVRRYRSAVGVIMILYRLRHSYLVLLSVVWIIYVVLTLHLVLC